MSKTCETCAHWRKRPLTVPRVNAQAGRVEQTVVGTCHANPPMTDHKWPQTLPTDGCSRHAGPPKAPKAKTETPNPTEQPQ